MNKIWENRLKKYQKMLLHYSKFVLNDHFVIALLFFVGGLGLAYSNFLQTLPAHPFWWEKPLVLILLVLFLRAGSLATLLQEPDTVFLMPQEHNLPLYLKRAVAHSVLLAEFFQLFFLLLLLPLLSRGLHLGQLAVGILGLTQLLLKYFEMHFEAQSAYISNYEHWNFKVLRIIAVPLIVQGLVLYVEPLAGFLVVLVIVGLQFMAAKKTAQHYVFRWNKMVELESNRMMRLYRFINLFTDVPQVSGKVRRLRFLDRFLPHAKRDGVFSYLYWRTFLRKSDFSGLYLRLLLLGSYLLLFIPNFWLSFVCILVFQYLIGFQLLPLFAAFEDNVFMYLYPLEKSDQLEAFKLVLRKLLFGSWFFFNLSALIALGISWNYLILLIASMLEIAVFTGNYLTKRLGENT